MLLILYFGLTKNPTFIDFIRAYTSTVRSITGLFDNYNVLIILFYIISCLSILVITLYFKFLDILVILKIV